jgi:hypothetical protein
MSTDKRASRELFLDGRPSGIIQFIPHSELPPAKVSLFTTTVAFFLISLGHMTFTL